MEASIDDLREIARLAVESDLQVLYLEIGDVKMCLGKSDAAASLLFGRLNSVEATAERTSPGPARSVPDAPAAEATGSPGTAAPAPCPPTDASNDAPPAPKKGLVDVRATSLGVMYRRPAPDQPPFVEVGAEVRRGDTVCLVEVMKTYSRVEAPCDGRVAEICVAEGTMAEHGQTLMRIEPASEHSG